jgi:chorismate mutase
MTTATTSPDSADSTPLTDSADEIPVLREQIDAMDAAIMRLVNERKRLSQRIQTARINSGGTRVELGRERLILDSYRQALGADGPLLADAVLRVCRGNR